MIRSLDNRRANDRHTNDRHGAFLICVLVAIGIVTSIMVTCVRSSLRTRHQLRVESQMEQTRWVVDAGIQRALNQYAANDRYVGESWDVTGALKDHSSAIVVIRVENASDDDSAIEVTVNAIVQPTDSITIPTQLTESIVVNKSRFRFDQIPSDTEDN